MRKIENLFLGKNINFVIIFIFHESIKKNIYIVYDLLVNRTVTDILAKNILVPLG
jgi:hypothetical protein